MASTEHLALGRKGEETAAIHLVRKGWTVLSRNWRPEGPARGLELDIVARDGDTLVFVEVKTRSASVAPGIKGAVPADTPPVAGPQAALSVPAHTALTRQKQTRLVKAASRYLTARDAWRLPCRFDLICIEYGSRGAPSLEHFTDVIELGHLVDRGHAAWQPW